MVALTTVTAANVAFVKRQPLTAVFVGATNGIGEFTVRQLCKTHDPEGPGLRVVLVGRNAKAAWAIIDECKAESPIIDFHFIQAGDISLLRTVDEACDKVQETLKLTSTAQIDMLIMSQGKVEFGGRIDTAEGLDRSMSLLYYSRMRFITRLLPLLSTSNLPNGAKVISIYAAGTETWGKLFPTDLSLNGSGNYSLANCRTHCVAMKTMFFEDLATKYPEKLGLTHMYPGLVVHSGFEDASFPWWFKVFWKIVKPFARFFPMYLTPEEIGQRVLYLCTERYPARGGKTDEDSKTDGVQIANATDGVRGNGAYSVTYTDEVNDIRSFYQELKTEQFQQSVLLHTEQVFEDIEKKGIFEPKKTA